MKILLLASGGGSLAKAIIDAKIEKVEIAALISDKQSPALDIARVAAIPDIYLPMSQDRSRWNAELIEAVAPFNPDLVVSVGFMRILAPEFLAKFPTINTHPALLPLFPGAHAVRDALAAGVRKTGATVHWVDAGVDTGPVIAQIELEIASGEDEESLHERIKILERLLIVETLSRFATSGIPEIQ
jgi:phosphoribosylglycinamide formyltransferase-1